MSIKSFFSIDLLIFLLLIIVISGVADGTPINMRTQDSSDATALQIADRSGKIDSDSIKLPATSVKYLSPQGNYQFVVTNSDNWASKVAQGKLIKSSGKKLQLVWKGTLPQEYGPRYVLVGSHGEVLMLDEWINVKSKHAITIVNPTLVGEASALRNRIFRYSFEEIQQVLQVPASAMVKYASQGSWWISQPPRLEERGAIAYVNTAGKILQIELATGAISLRKISQRES